MKLNKEVFLATAIVHSGLLADTPLPQDPTHAANAKYIVTKLFALCREDSALTLAASHVVCAFIKNKASGHCTPDELVSHGVRGVHQILDALSGPTAPMGIATGAQAPPQTAVPPPVPLPQPTFPEPVTPLEVPDFG